MRKIWKFQLPLETIAWVAMPLLAEVISTGLDPAENLCVWAVVDPNRELSKRMFLVIGTAHPLPDEVKLSRFLGTVRQGPFMWHVYEYQGPVVAP